MAEKIKMSRQKFCTLPGQRMIRCASTMGGLSCLIGENPRQIPEVFVQDALSQGAITEEMLNRIKAGADKDEEMLDETMKQRAALIQPPAALTSTPGLSAENRFKRINEAFRAIHQAGKVEDFTQQGLVQVSALSAACGFEVTAAERDAAFAEMKKDQE